MTRSGVDLEVRELTIEYTSGGYVVRPIQGLGLEAARGEIVLLLGASGCGKTTLLSVLAAILTPTAGRVRFDDIDVTGLRGATLTRYRRHTVGVVFQAFNLVPSLTARENVQVPMGTAGLSGRPARQRAESLLAEVGLATRARHRPGDLSGGEQQRVAIARALANDPPLVLADESTAHLDYIQVDGVLRLLRQIADAGRLVVVATHDDRMLPLADRVVNLTPRRDTESRPPETVTLDDGDLLFDQGDTGELVYVVDRGAIDIVRRQGDGSEELLTTVVEGGYFGELAPTFGLRRSATARAAASSTVTGYTVRDFRDRVRPGTLADAVTDQGL
ncbi:MAG TPA: ATP-binding cassette domain-containing protein [Acidimicrobiales bacterium]|nr:ATP-binding cassette domain-containing protein [Acidimicrobiales bacterium]